MVIRKERGWAGHGLISSRCMFRRNTLLQKKDISIVVSTIGLYYYENKFVEVGINKYFETMAFYSLKTDKKYFDADVSRPVYFDSKSGVNTLGDDNEANDMHENVVSEIIQKIENNTIK